MDCRLECSKCWMSICWYRILFVCLYSLIGISRSVCSTKKSKYFYFKVCPNSNDIENLLLFAMSHINYYCQKCWRLKVWACSISNKQHKKKYPKSWHRWSRSACTIECHFSHIFCVICAWIWIFGLSENTNFHWLKVKFEQNLTKINICFAMKTQ